MLVKENIVELSPNKDGVMILDFNIIRKAALIYRAINHKLRQQIIKLVDNKGKITVTEVYVSLRIEQSVASQHLAILRQAGIVDTVRDGKFIYYSLNKARIEQIIGVANELVDIPKN